MLSYLLEHAAWANSRVLAAAQNLTPDERAHDFKTSEHSLQATLTHIYRADRVWLARLEGQPVPFQTPGDDTMQVLLEDWPALSQRWIAWSKTANPDARVSYQDLRGQPWTQPLWQIIHHVANHATHHRGQAIGFLRALGHPPPNIDSITFARERSNP